MIHSIQDVIQRQTQIVDDAIKNKSRLGYFACLYLEMTKTVKRNIEQGKFEDNVRMEKLVVIFANRYFDAYALWKSGKKPSYSWQLAFDETNKNNLTVIQHLLNSINAHINLDLGIAAAQVCPGNSIGGLKKDFDKINEVLASLLDTVQVKLGRICWPMKLLDRIGKNSDEQLANFCLGMSRKSAWTAACAMAVLPQANHAAFIQTLDTSTSLLAKLIINPGSNANIVLNSVKLFEPKSPVEIIKVMLDK